MKLILTISIISLFYNQIYSSGRCGKTNPSSSADCVPYSNSTDLCCFVNSTNAPSAFSVCTTMKSSDVYSFITVGNMQYTVDCKGVPNYNELFPYDQDFSPCGINNPGEASDCNKYSIDSKACCITGTTQDFSGNTNCYYYPRHISANPMNYTDSNRLGKTLYFWCDGCYLSMKIGIIFLFIFLILSGVF
jgi:hypothetical protein